MKRILTLLVIPALMVGLVTPVLAQVSLPYTTDLIADGRETALDVGDLTVAADGTITFQIVETEPAHGWLLEETHLYVGDEAPAKSAPGLFNYGEDGLDGVDSYSCSVDLAAFDVNEDGIVYIAAHAELIKQIGEDPDTAEPIYAYETAWAQGDEPIGKGKNWATCFDVWVPQAAQEQQEQQVVEPQAPQEQQEQQAEEPGAEVSVAAF
jgi:hypothetical protein